ncbi:zinc ribbon domain-containing protein [Nocardia sp. NPDC052112]|uniref:zinc ribbon domain-containing protein n=1 Tax=Nocardia sp. NPDC052112 TaxID=3155646 RepID=UPI00341D7C16
MAGYRVPEGWTVQAYRFALDPTPAQKRVLASHVGAARKAFNVMLDVVKKNLDQRACSGCGAKTKLPLHERIYHCVGCGLVIDRDLNAAINLARLGDTTHIGGGMGTDTGSSPAASHRAGQGRGADRKTHPAHQVGKAGGVEASTPHGHTAGKTGTAAPQGTAA